jgi:hypothetical protein
VHVLRRAGLVAGPLAGMTLVACGSAGDMGAGATAVSGGEACAFVGPLNPAVGVGPTVIFVTRGPGAQQACDAELKDPKNTAQHLAPAYLPSGAPSCTYVDSHDAPPEGGRTYEIYGSGASALCESIGSRPSGTAP